MVSISAQFSRPFIWRSNSLCNFAHVEAPEIFLLLLRVKTQPFWHDLRCSMSNGCGCWNDGLHQKKILRPVVNQVYDLLQENSLLLRLFCVFHSSDSCLFRAVDEGKKQWLRGHYYWSVYFDNNKLSWSRSRPNFWRVPTSLYPSWWSRLECKEQAKFYEVRILKRFEARPEICDPWRDGCGHCGLHESPPWREVCSPLECGPRYKQILLRRVLSWGQLKLNSG